MYSVSVNVADETETTVFVLFSKALNNSLFLFIQHGHRYAADANHFIGFVCDPNLPNLSFLSNVYGFCDTFHKTTSNTAEMIRIDIEADAKLLVGI